jgi:hypothetical protein
MKRWLLATALASAAAGACAAPMGFKDSWMSMIDLGPNWQEAGFNHAVTSRDAFGATVLNMKSDDDTLRRTFTEATYTRLVKRWNLPHAQANAWFFFGAGVMSGNDFSGSQAAVSPGLQLDYETTRLYLAATARLLRSEDLKHDYGSVRAGFSFYEVDYDEVQPWLILEARRTRGLSDKTEVTPMLRLIHKRYFVELGVNTDGQPRANLMYTF